MLKTCLASACMLVLAAPAAGQLSVSQNGHWVEWYRPDRAPRAWPSEDARLRSAIRWRQLGGGIELGELRLQAGSPLLRFTAVVARFDAKSLSFTLTRMDDWSVANAPSQTVIAFNAGRSTQSGPWGWLVQDGETLQGVVPDQFSSAVAQDGSGRIHIVEHDQIAALQAAARLRWAFQSGPTLLIGDGEVPSALLTRGRGVDIDRRDARLAICTTREQGTMVILTRYNLLRGMFERARFGPTIPEMAALAGGLGCRHAVLLGGGRAAQLLVRTTGGGRGVWKARDKVPLGLSASYSRLITR